LLRNSTEEPLPLNKESNEPISNVDNGKLKSYSAGKIILILFYKIMLNGQMINIKSSSMYLQNTLINGAQSAANCSSQVFQEEGTIM
jgi:hypothetical protein